MATNEEMVVSAFQKTVSIRSSFNLANMLSYDLTNDLIPFWEQKLKNGRLAAILNLSNFGIFK